MSHGGVCGSAAANHFLRPRQFGDVIDGVIELLITYERELGFRFYQILDQAFPDHLGQTLVFLKALTS